MKTFTPSEVQEVVKQVQYLYGLKYEIRYGLNRDEKDFTESVAEHIFGMHILADYFLELEDKEGKWDRAKIRQLITWHDIDEVETGDTIGWKKTDADRAREGVACDVVVSKLPLSLQASIGEMLREYTTQNTVEACFVKAIDKVEPLFHIYNERGKILCHKMGLTYEASDRIKRPYVKNFPHIKQFSETIQDLMKVEDFFIA